MARKRSRRQVGYAVIGLGHIAQTAVLPAFKHANNAKLVAIVSSNEEKRRKLARRYGCDAFSVDHLNICLDLAAVDAVYIANLNYKHAELAIRSPRQARQVSCE